MEERIATEIEEKKQLELAKIDDNKTKSIDDKL